MSPELEVLDQLQDGGALPLRVLVPLFADEAHARRGIGALVGAGEVHVLDANGAALSRWQVRGLERQPGSWRDDVQHRVTITDAGARRIGG